MESYNSKPLDSLIVDFNATTSEALIYLPLKGFVLLKWPLSDADFQMVWEHLDILSQFIKAKDR